MKKQDPERVAIQTHDYEEARQRAVSWLGDRYLLAEPAARRSDKPAGYFAVMPGWHGRVRPTLRTRH